MTPDDILATYDRHAAGYARTRDRRLTERRWLDAMLGHAPGRRVLDLGCGTGLPIARYLAERRAQVTGLDGAAAMLALFRANVPGAEAIEGDMRTLDLDRRFDAILAWDSLFHLAPDAQRAMFPRLAAHAAPGGVLMFTSGPSAGEPVGRVDGAPVYHASLDPEDYRRRLAASGFEVIRFVPDDPECSGHSVWLARLTA